MPLVFLQFQNKGQGEPDTNDGSLYGGEAGISSRSTSFRRKPGSSSSSKFAVAQGLGGRSMFLSPSNRSLSHKMDRATDGERQAVWKLTSVFAEAFRHSQTRRCTCF